LDEEEILIGIQAVLHNLGSLTQQTVQFLGNILLNLLTKDGKGFEGVGGKRVANFFQNVKDVLNKVKCFIIKFGYEPLNYLYCGIVWNEWA